MGYFIAAVLLAAIAVFRILRNRKKRGSVSGGFKCRGCPLDDSCNSVYAKIKSE